MPRYWAFRTDGNNRDFLVEELHQGRLRQGWGYNEKTDLTVLGPKATSQGIGSLDLDERAAWNRCQRMWPDHWGPIAEGDVILLPKLPEDRHFSLARVAGPYRFEISATGDFGHILPVEILREGISNQNEHVESGLQRTLRCQRPIWNLDGHAEEVEKLLTFETDSLTVAHDDFVRLQNIQAELHGQLAVLLSKEFRGNQFEGPVGRLLRAVFPDGLVEVAAGPNEQGADYVVELPDPFGYSRRLVLQLKAWEGLVNDGRVLDQLREAVTTRNADEAILLTTAEGESESFEKGREELEQELSVPVRVVPGDVLTALFLEHFQGIIGAESSD